MNPLRPLLALVASAAVLSCASAPTPRRAESAATRAARPAVSEPARSAPTRLPSNAVPKRYALTLRIDPRQPRFSGEAEIAIEVRERSHAVHLHAHGLALEEVVARAGARTLTAKVEDSSAAPGTEGERSLSFSEPLEPGEWTLRLRYTAPFNPRLAGLYRAKEGDHWYASTQFEPIDARTAFPCFDEPGFRTPWKISLTVPDGMLAVSNGPELSRRSHEGWTTFSFAETPAISSYLVAFAVGPWEVAEGAPYRFPIRGLSAKGKSELIRDSLVSHRELVEYLERYFEYPYPFAKLDALAALEFSQGAMENPGLIVYREDYLLADPRRTPENARREIAHTIAHELAHQWFGNLVTMQWWDDLWLNEAFAEWLSAKVVDQWKPELEARFSVLGRRGWMFNQDARSTVLPIRQDVSSVAQLGSSFALATFKGAAVLTMIEDWTGEMPFRDGVRRYIKAKAWSNATSDDLFEALDAATAKDVRGVARSFLDQPGVPLVSARPSCVGGKPAVELSQTRYLPLGSPEVKPTVWKVPVCVAYPDGDRVERACRVLDSERATFALPEASACPGWVHPNAGEYGYYRWSVPADQVVALGAAVERPWENEGAADRSSLAARSRAALMDQVWAGVAAGQLEPAGYFSLVEASLKQGDRRAFQNAAAMVQRVVTYWPDVAKGPGFQAWIRRTFSPLAKRLGFTARPGDSADDRAMRPGVLGLLAVRGGDERARRAALEHARSFVRDPRSVPAELLAVSLSVAAEDGALKTRELLQLLDRAHSPVERNALVAALGSVPTGAPLDEVLALTLTERIRMQDAGALLYSSFDEEPRRSQAFAFVQANFDELGARMNSFGGDQGAAVLAQLVGEFCAPEQRDAARAFFEGKQLPHAQRFLATGVERANQCIALRTHGQRSATEFFSSP